MPLKPNVIVDIDGVIIEWIKQGNTSEEEKYTHLMDQPLLPGVYEAIQQLKKDYRIVFCTARHFDGADSLTREQLQNDYALLEPEDTLLVGVPSEFKCYLVKPFQAKFVIDDHPNAIESMKYVRSYCLPIFITRGRSSYGFEFEANDLPDAITKLEQVWSTDLTGLVTYDLELKHEKKYLKNSVTSKRLEASQPKQLLLSLMGSISTSLQEA